MMINSMSDASVVVAVMPEREHNREEPIDADDDEMTVAEGDDTGADTDDDDEETVYEGIDD
jgi:hypothetical protein